MAWGFMARTEPTLRARAMRFLARREHSRAELQRKLAPLAGEGDDVLALLEDFARRGWLSDRRFAEQLIRAKARRFGPLKLARELRAKGIDEETIAAGFRAAEIDPMAARMQAVWASRFRAKPVEERELARQARFLQGRGFPLDDILKFLKEAP
jgi:regulatory protein